MNRVLAGYVRAGYIRVNRVLVRKVCGVKAEKFCQQIERTCDQHRAARAGPRHGCGMGQSLRQRLTKWIEPAAVGRERSAERGDADFVRYAPKWSRIGNTQLLFLSSRPV